MDIIIPYKGLKCIANSLLQIAKDYVHQGLKLAYFFCNCLPRIHGFFMRTAKTDQNGQLPRLIRVFAGCTGYFVGFVVRWLNLSVTATQF